MQANLKKLLKNTLIAQALGDAFGYIIEFKNWEEIKRIYGPSGLLYNPKGLTLIVSDDTQMSLFCLEGLINSQTIVEQNGQKLENPIDEIFKSYLDWHKTQDGYYNNDTVGLLRFKELFYRRAPGNTCMVALGSKRKGTIKNRINDSKGCGGIMRTIPVSFFASSASEAFEWGAKQAALTHGHPDGYLSAGLYSALAYELIHGERNIIKALKKSENLLKQYENSHGMIETVNKTFWAINQIQGLKNNELTAELGEGWVGDHAFAVAVYCATTATTFSEVLEVSANHSGDSDSTAMLAAGLWYLSTRDESFVDDIKYLDLANCIIKIIDDL